jgi:hypothetical protein
MLEINKHEFQKKIQKLESTNSYGPLIYQIWTLFSKVLVSIIFCCIDDDQIVS